MSHVPVRSGGVVLFIDECEAFLGTRGNGGKSHGDDAPDQRQNNVSANGPLLSALLSLTGSQRTDVMLVLATNRPSDLDVAVRDRIDVSIRMPLPGLEERKQLVRQWWDVLVLPIAVSTSTKQIGTTA